MAGTNDEREWVEKREKNWNEKTKGILREKYKPR